MEDDKLIAAFDELGINENKLYLWMDVYNNWDTYSLDELRYRTDWNWIIPVAKKIMNTPHSLDARELVKDVKQSVLTFDRDKVYNACVAFLKWLEDNGGKAV